MKQISSVRPHRSGSGLTLTPGVVAFGAAALVALGLTRKSKTGAAVAAGGGVLAYRALQRRPAGRTRTHAEFLVATSPEKAYALWRKLEELPRFMAHLKSVRLLDGRRSEWTGAGPLGREITWVAEMTEDVPSKRLAWRSEQGSQVHTHGSVTFRADPLGRGTFVRAEVSYLVPGAPVTTGVAALFGKHPQFVIREDVRRFKALLEAGEVPTTAGQPHGPRGIHGQTSRFLLRETSNTAEPVLETQARKTA